jgi:hypothetical protein
MPEPRPSLVAYAKEGPLAAAGALSGGGVRLTDA